MKRLTPAERNKLRDLLYRSEWFDEQTYELYAQVRDAVITEKRNRAGIKGGLF